MPEDVTMACPCGCGHPEHAQKIGGDGGPPAAPTTVRDFTAIVAALDPTYSDSLRWNYGSGSGTVGASVVVSYTFLDRKELPAPGDLSYTTTGIHSFDGTQRDNFRDAVATIEAISGIRFVEVEDPDLAQIDVLRVEGSPYGGWATLPGAEDGVLVVDDTGSFDPGTFGYLTILHELGHALGLTHSFSGGIQLADDLDDTRQTVMSYTQPRPYDDGLGPLDIDALRYLYGSDYGFDLGFRANGVAIDGTGAADQIFAAYSSDRVEGRGGDDLIDLMDGDDIARGGDGDDTIDGGRGDDDIKGNKGNDRLDGRDGDDTLLGGDGNDTLDGDEGHDLLLGQNQDDTIYGRAGNDRIEGGKGVDRLFGGEGDDTLKGGKGDDTLSGGEGDDILKGQAGAGSVFGGAGNDVVRGQGGFLQGDDGDDLVIHEGGSSGFLFGGDGQDTLVGGAGTTQFSFDTADTGEIDIVRGFVSADDFFYVVGGSASARSIDQQGDDVRVAHGDFVFLVEDATVGDIGGFDFAY